MKKSKLTDPPKSNLYLIECGVILILLTLKSYFFNQYIKLGSFSLVMTAATVAIFAVFFLVRKLTSKKSPAPPLFALYITASLLMVIDRMYFAYFNKLPGILALQLVEYLGTVSSSVADIFNLSHALYLIDLPILLLYLLLWRRKAAFALRKTKFKSCRRNLSKFSAGVASGILAGCMVFIGCTLMSEHFHISYFCLSLYFSVSVYESS